MRVIDIDSHLMEPHDRLEGFDETTVESFYAGGSLADYLAVA